jgi:hypothetical protein
MDLDLQIIDLQVQKLVEKFAARLESELGIKNDPDKARSACFVFLVAKTVMELDDDEAFDTLVDGGNDCGIDALYVDDVVGGTFTTTLFQGKYAKSIDGNSGFKMSGVEKMIGALGSIFDPSKTMMANKRLEPRLAEIRSLIADGGNIPKVRVILCNNGKTWESNAQQLITNGGWSQVKWEHVNHHALLKAQQSTEPVKEVLSLTGKGLLENFQFRRVLVGKMKLTELAALFNRNADQGDRLLERNVRRYLGLTGNPVNEGIRQTLLDPADRDNFYFYNNGITFTCTKFSHNEFQNLTDLSVHVEGLQVINGGQTCKTVQRVLGELAGTEPPNSSVLIRLYELPADDPALVVRITEATNSQSPVDFRDRKANDVIQRKLELGLQELGYTYRRKRSVDGMKQNEITSGQAAEAVFAAVRGMPHLIRYRTHQLFQLRYEEIFTATLSPAEIVVSVTLLRYAETKRKQAAEEAPPFIAYASTFIAMLMYRSILSKLKQPADQLTHRNFAEAKTLWDVNQERYYSSALAAIAAALVARQHPADVSLRKVSAEFRRADLLELLNRPAAAAAPTA